MAKKKRKKAKNPVKRFKKQRQTRKKKNIKNHHIVSGRKRSIHKKIRRKKPVKRKAPRKKPAKRKIIKQPKQHTVTVPQKTHEEPKAIHTMEEKPSKPLDEKIHASPASKPSVIKGLFTGAAIAAVLALLSLFYIKTNKCGEAYAGITHAYMDGQAREAREGKPNKALDLSKKYYNIISEAAAKSGMKKAELEYFNGHFEAQEITARPRKNNIAFGLVYAEKTAKIIWFRNMPCGRSKTRKWLLSRPEQDKKKIDAFVSAANVFITDPDVRGEVIEYYTGPVVKLDLAADVGPYYLYYLSHAFIFENYPAINGIAPQYPPAVEGDQLEFLAMEEMFKIFEGKAMALVDLSALIDASAGRINDRASEKVKKAAAELSEAIDAADSETTQKFIITALQASLAARQWAKMENSRHKKPWFETTYDDDLDDAKVKRYLNRLKSAMVSPQERKLISAAALMLYKTSRCMKTFTWRKKYTAYAENYRLAHSIIMHYVNGYDTALCKKLADELDRYYAGRYYGTISR